MKTFGHFYDEICSFENLHRAYLKARRGKRYALDCLRFSAHLEENLLVLRRELAAETYRTGLYKRFMVYEPKPREIAALPFRDRVVQHANCKLIEPKFEPRLYEHSYSVRVGKGTHRGVDYMQAALRQMSARGRDVWILKCDIRRYFPSIRHDVLMQLIARHIRCERTLTLLERIVDSAGELDAEVNARRGVPIGNLTSQFFANVYLTPLDRFVKHELRVRWYVRYMDDWCIVGHDKRELLRAKATLVEFLWDTLSLRLHPKSQVFPLAQGVNFLGYRVWPTHRLLRKSSVKRMRRKLKVFARKYAEGEMEFGEINATVQSWLGHAQHANSFRLRTRLFDEFTLRRGSYGERTHD